MTEPKNYAIPDGRRVYAIGDIHGCLSLLKKMHDAIAADMDVHPDHDHTIIYLGDYIDRGPDNRAVVDLMLDNPMADRAKCVYLKGNHENALLKFIETGTQGENWFQYGGIETIMDYGVPLNIEAPLSPQLPDIRAMLVEKLPQAHIDFYKNLDLYHRIGDYVFVHAGIRPDRPMAMQVGADLMYIRDPFLTSEEDFGFRVVHGHTIHPEPVIRYNRIGIDTGAFAYGRLSAVVLQKDTYRIIQVSM